MTDFIHPSDGHATRKVLAGCDLAHHCLHAAKRTRDLAVQQQTDRCQQNNGDAGDDRDGGRRRRERAVQRRDGFVLLAILFHTKGLDDLLELVTILGHVGEQIGLREFVLAGRFHLRRFIDRREVVLDAVARLRYQPFLRVAGGIFCLQRERLLQRRLPCLEFFLRLRDDVAVRRVDQRHRRQLHVLDLRHQIGGGQRAGHHALRHLPDLGRAAPCLVDGITAYRREGDEHQDDQ